MGLAPKAPPHGYFSRARMGRRSHLATRACRPSHGNCVGTSLSQPPDGFLCLTRIILAGGGGGEEARNGVCVKGDQKIQEDCRQDAQARGFSHGHDLGAKRRVIQRNNQGKNLASKREFRRRRAAGLWGFVLINDVQVLKMRTSSTDNIGAELIQRN